MSYAVKPKTPAYKLPECSVRKLQKVHGTQIVLDFIWAKCCKKWDSGTPLLIKAYFLHANERILYKIAQLAFKCTNNLVFLTQSGLKISLTRLLGSYI